MSRILDAAGSSHFNQFQFANTWEKRNVLTRQHPFQYVNKCTSFPGLSVMDDLYERETFQMLNPESREFEQKRNQRNRFFNTIKKSQCNEILLVLLSNDIKAFITDPVNQKPFKLIRTAHKIWLDMSSEDKQNLNIFNTNLCKRDFQQHLLKKFEIYESLLLPIFKETKINIVHHSSILERLHSNIENFDMYFSIVNSVLHFVLNKWTQSGNFKNKFNQPIQFRFVNVSEQIHSKNSIPEKISIFRLKEIEKCNGLKERNNTELVHRDKNAYYELADLWIKNILTSRD